MRATPQHSDPRARVQGRGRAGQAKGVRGEEGKTGRRDEEEKKRDRKVGSSEKSKGHRGYCLQTQLGGRTDQMRMDTGIGREWAGGVGRETVRGPRVRLRSTREQTENDSPKPKQAYVGNLGLLPAGVRGVTASSNMAWPALYLARAGLGLIRLTFGENFLRFFNSRIWRWQINFVVSLPNRELAKRIEREGHCIAGSSFTHIHKRVMMIS